MAPTQLQTNGAYTIKHYQIVTYRFCSKLVCLSKPVKVTIEKTFAYHEICPFSVNYESVKFYSKSLL